MWASLRLAQLWLPEGNPEFETKAGLAKAASPTHPTLLPPLLPRQRHPRPDGARPAARLSPLCLPSLSPAHVRSRGRGVSGFPVWLWLLENPGVFQLAADPGGLALRQAWPIAHRTHGAPNQKSATGVGVLRCVSGK